ncbi:MAG TPA: flagellin, partial [Rhizobacter sp.]|nr:flagellin [Rhizobacter sp.]
TGNGVFVTSSAAGNSGGAWIDSGGVTNPSAVTGSAYSLQFSVAGGVTTYSVLKDGVPTAAAGVPYKSGQAISVDGLSATVTGQPADADQFDLTPSTANLNVFDAIDKAVTDLKTPMRSAAQVSQSNSSSIASMDASMSQLESVRSQVGETLNRIDSATGRLDDLKLSSETARSDAQGLDMVKAISDFQNKQTGYDAALKSYSLVQKLSLFNYIS